MIVTLERFAYTPFGTLGRLTYGDRTLFTVERPWLGNKAFESCIPEGVYTCRRYSSARYPDTFQVLDVPERTYILFHAGNTAKDVQGCIALGLRLSGQNCAVSKSRLAVAQFIVDMAGVSEFCINITHFSADYKQKMRNM